MIASRKTAFDKLVEELKGMFVMYAVSSARSLLLGYSLTTCVALIGRRINGRKSRLTTPTGNGLTRSISRTTTSSLQRGTTSYTLRLPRIQPRLSGRERGPTRAKSREPNIYFLEPVSSSNPGHLVNAISPSATLSFLMPHLLLTQAIQSYAYPTL